MKTSNSPSRQSNSIQQFEDIGTNYAFLNNNSSTSI